MTDEGEYVRFLCAGVKKHIEVKANGDYTWTCNGIRPKDVVKVDLLVSFERIIGGVATSFDYNNLSVTPELRLKHSMPGSESAMKTLRLVCFKGAMEPGWRPWRDLEEFSEYCKRVAEQEKDDGKAVTALRRAGDVPVVYVYRDSAGLISGYVGHSGDLARRDARHHGEEVHHRSTNRGEQRDRPRYFKEGWELAATVQGFENLKEARRFEALLLQLTAEGFEEKMAQVRELASQPRWEHVEVSEEEKRGESKEEKDRGIAEVSA